MTELSLGFLSYIIEYKRKNDGTLILHRKHISKHLYLKKTTVKQNFMLHGSEKIDIAYQNRSVGEK